NLPAEPHRPASIPEVWRGKDSNLRRRKPADLQSAPVGRLGTPPQNEPRILISGCQSVNASGPLFAWGAAAGKPLRPAAVSGTPLPPALEAGIAPGGPAPGPGWRPGLPGAAERALQARDEGGIGAACLAGTQ